MDKREILFHWLYFYGVIPRSIEDLNEFYRLINVRFNDLYNYAIATHADGLSEIFKDEFWLMTKDEFLNKFSVKFSKFVEEHNGAYEMMEENLLNSVINSKLNTEGPLDLEMFGKGR